MASVVELMREYKRLKALKQSGEISAQDAQQLREVANFLKSEMDKRNSGAGSAPKAPSARGSAPRSAPSPAPTAAPTPVATPIVTPVHVPAASAPVPAAPPVPPAKPLWQQQAEEQAERQKRAQAHFQVEVPDEVQNYQPSETPISSPIAELEVGADPADADDDLDLGYKKRPRPRNENEMQEQMQEIYAASQFTRSDEDLQTELYYSYADEGYSPVEDEDEDDIELDPIDPREIELQRAGLLNDDNKNGIENAVICVPGGVFLDDFMALYEQGILPRPDDDTEPEIDDPDALVPGKRKVTLHMLNGQVKRGSIGKIMRQDLGFKLDLGRGQIEEIDFAHVKALFIMKGKGEAPDLSNARKLTIEFKDRRRVMGLSPDYQPGAFVFTLVPSGPGNFERVIVHSGAAARIV